MDEAPETDGTRKIKIRPRAAVVEKPEGVEGEASEGATSESRLKNRLKPSGTKFPAKFTPVEVEPESEVEEEAFDEEGEHSGRRRRVKHHNKEDETPSARELVAKALMAPIPLVFPVAVLGFGTWLAWTLAYDRGARDAKEDYNIAATKERVEVPPEFAETLNRAVTTLRDGDPREALKTLQELELSYPNISSLTFLVAMAAMQSGEISLAERKVEQTIAKKERVADALAIQAVLETQKAQQPGYKSLGDPKARAEGLLRRAILADSASPFPYIELSTLLRYQGRNDEALALLRAARARLNPVDSHTVVDVTTRLMELERMPDEKLPAFSGDVPPDPASLFGAAYAATRQKDFARAAVLLGGARDRMAPDLFYYLVNDPAFRRHSREAPMAPFFE